MTAAHPFFPATEEIISDAPLTLRRVVRWGECDPAGIVYTPRFLDYCVSAGEAFLGFLTGGPVHRKKDALGVDFPMRGAELDFRSPLPLDATFDMALHVGRIGAHSFDLHITARHAGGAVPGPIAFLGRLTPITVDRITRKAVPLPDPLKTRVEHYAARFPRKDADA